MILIDLLQVIDENIKEVVVMSKDVFEVYNGKDGIDGKCNNCLVDKITAKDDKILIDIITE